MKRYIVVGGNPYIGYTNTATFTSIGVIGNFDSLDLAQNCASEKYEDVGGLLLIIDTEDITKEVPFG